MRPVPQSLFSVLVLVVWVAIMPGRAQSLIEINDRQYWLNGINMPWNAFGADFGEHYQWGRLYNASVFEACFKKYNEQGINAVRIWVHCDCRASPEFDVPGGYVTGLDSCFFDDFDDMLRLATQYGLFIMPALWSFDMVKPAGGAGQYSGTARPLIDDTLKTRSYIDRVLVPLVKRYDSHPNLFAWEICNQPEWMVENHGISQANLVRFHAMQAAAIHREGTKPVTTGASSVKWNSSAAGCVGNWWSNTSLQSAYPDPEAYLDFYQIHFYAWMIPWGYNPYVFDVAHYGIGDRPVIIGESPGQTVDADGFTMTLSQMYETALLRGYAGVFAWSDRASDGAGDWNSIQIATSAFYRDHPAEVDGIPTAVLYSGEETKTGAMELTVHTDPVTFAVFISYQLPKDGPVRLSLWDGQGHLVRELVSGTMPKGSQVLRFGFKRGKNRDGIYVLRLNSGGQSVSRKLFYLQ